MQKITPFLWFTATLEEAATFTLHLQGTRRWARFPGMADAGPGPKGSAMSVTFQIEGAGIFALNGGPQSSSRPPISFFVNCETQQEVDELLGKLSAVAERDRLRLAAGTSSASPGRSSPPSSANCWATSDPAKSETAPCRPCPADDQDRYQKTPARRAAEARIKLPLPVVKKAVRHQPFV